MHVVSEDHAINQDRRARVKYIGFTALVGVLLLLNFVGWFDTLFGIDTALFLTLIAGYKPFYRAISHLLDRKISAALAIVIAAFPATLVGEYLAAAEAMFIMLVGEGLEAWAAGRTEAAIHRFVDQLPRHATALRDGREVHVHVEDLVPDDIILVRAGERIAADGVIEARDSSVDESRSRASRRATGSRRRRLLQHAQRSRSAAGARQRRGIHAGAADQARRGSPRPPSRWCAWRTAMQYFRRPFC